MFTSLILRHNIIIVLCCSIRSLPSIHTIIMILIIVQLILIIISQGFVVNNNNTIIQPSIDNNNNSSIPNDGLSSEQPLIIGMRLLSSIILIGIIGFLMGIIMHNRNNMKSSKQVI